MTIQWGPPSPWRTPTDASINAILKKYGVEESGGQISIDPSVLIPQLTPEENQAISAKGYFGNPLSPVEGADYSEFEGVIGESPGDGTGTTLHVYQGGEEIEKRHYPEGVNGDTVALWNEVA